MPTGDFSAPTLCWECVNAVPDRCGHGCAWSRKLQPVEGWEAEHTVTKHHDSFYGVHYDEGYRVIRCPEYVKG